MPGPSKINQSDNIPRGLPSLLNLIFHGNPLTGQGLACTVQELLTLVTGTKPVTSFPTEADMLADTTLPVGYMAYVSETGVTYLYNGPTHDNIANYSLVGSGGEGGGGQIGQTASAIWKFDTVTSPSPEVGSGVIRFNNTVAAAITEMYLSEQSNDGQDTENFLRSLQVNDTFYIQEKGNSTRWLRAVATAEPIENDDWWTVPIDVVESSGTLPANNAETIVRATFGSAEIPEATNTVKGILKLFDSLNIVAPRTDGALQEAVAISSFMQKSIYDPDGDNIVSFARQITSTVNFQGAVNAGEPVYVSGWTGTMMQVNKANASSLSTLPALGIAIANQAAGSNGVVVTYGRLMNQNTGSFGIGQPLYVAVGGGITNVEPLPHSQVIGICLRAGGSDGIIAVFPQPPNQVTNRQLTAISVAPSGGVLTLDCQNKQEVKFLCTTAITGSTSIVFTNASNLIIAHLAAPITGTNIPLTWPSEARMSRYNETASGDGWNATSKILTITSVGAGDLWEFSYIKMGTIYKINYDGPTRP